MDEPLSNQQRSAVLTAKPKPVEHAVQAAVQAEVLRKGRPLTRSEIARIRKEVGR